MQLPELKPCPSCGGHAEIMALPASGLGYYVKVFVECSRCGLRTEQKEICFTFKNLIPQLAKATSKAAKNWNRRI